MVNCIYCSTFIHPNSFRNSFKCCTCIAWAHKDCIPTKHAESLLNTGLFCCDSCTVPHNTSMGSPSSFQFDTLESLSQKHITPLRADFAEFNERFASIHARLECLETENANLRAELLKVKSVPSIDLHQTVFEISDQIARAQNVILFNLDECNATNSSTKDNNYDEVQIKNILRPIRSEENIISSARIGRRFTRPRSINIVLKNRDLAVDVIRRRQELNLGNMHIKPDRTQHQLDLLKKVQDELKSRIDNGERNIKLSYNHRQGC